MAIKFKAVEPTPTPPPTPPPTENPPPQAPTGPSTDEAIAMKKKLEEALAQLDKANEYDQYLAVGDKAQLEKSKALLMADIQVIDYYLKTGEWIGAMLPENAAGGGNQYVDVTELDAGFYVSNPDTPTAAPVKVTEGPDGKLYVDDNGGTSVLTFVMESSKDKSKNMVGAKLTSVGKDAVITVYFDDGSHEDHTVDRGSVRSDLQIQIVGINCTEDLTLDATGYVNIDPVTGHRGGAVLIGSKHNDILLGGAGRDTLMGLGGSDTMDGGSHVDDVWGYASVGDTNGDGFVDGLMDVYGEDAEEVLGTDKGDNIYDMFGLTVTTSDDINGGAGIDTVYRGKTVTGAQVKGDLVEGPPVEMEASDPADIEDWLGDSQGWSAKPTEDGELVVTKDDGTVGGTVDINIPENTEPEDTEFDKYMASAVKDDNDLLLNVVKLGKEGEEPSYYRIRIKGYFNEDNVKLNITGSFVDMGSTEFNELNVGARPVVLNGYGDDGDILIGPKTIFEDYGMSVEDLGKTTKNKDEVQDQLDGFNEALEPMWAKAVVDDEGNIVIKDNEDLTNYLKDGEFYIPTDFGAVAFVRKIAGGYEVTVASNEGLTSKTTVIKIITDQKLTFKMNGTTSDLYDLTNVNEYGVTINGNGGADLLAGYKYGTKFVDEGGDDAKVAIGVPATGDTGGIKDHPEVPSDGTELEESLTKEINGAKTLAELEKIYDEKIAKLEDSDDPADKELAETLLGELVEKCNSLLEDWIGDLEGAIGAYEKSTDEDQKAKDKTDIDKQIDEITAMLGFLKGKEDDDAHYDIQEEAFNDAVEESEDFDDEKL